jgi:UDP-2,3-diacylglucosamine hydrolase
LPDPSLVDLHGTPTLLMHGDLLCSDDQAYQGFRRKIRDPLHIKDFLGQSLRQRLDQARNYRLKSGEAKSLKSESIMDVNQQTVESYLIEHGAERLIHGHTHRPADHHIELQGKRCDRHVLAQWQLDHGELICLTPDGLHRERVD